MAEEHTIEAFQRRFHLVEEKIVLDGKIGALRVFLNTPIADDAERSRLIRQLAYMESYSNVLAERIGAFGV